jgi:antitoxin component YwqK of YwqJK toxin-antitoxin module
MNHKEYHENGQVFYEYNTKDGLMDRVARNYTDDGELYRESNFKNGKAHGITTHFQGGKKHFVVNYKHGIPNGIEYYFSYEGCFLRLHQNKGELMNGLYMTFGYGN